MTIANVPCLIEGAGALQAAWPLPFRPTTPSRGRRLFLVDRGFVSWPTPTCRTHKQRRPSGRRERACLREVVVGRPPPPRSEQPHGSRMQTGRLRRRRPSGAPTGPLLAGLSAPRKSASQRSWHDPRPPWPEPDGLRSAPVLPSCPHVSPGFLACLAGPPPPRSALAKAAAVVASPLSAMRRELSRGSDPPSPSILPEGAWLTSWANAVGGGLEGT